jgi:hypothetical protein
LERAESLLQAVGLDQELNVQDERGPAPFRQTTGANEVQVELGTNCLLQMPSSFYVQSKTSTIYPQHGVNELSRSSKKTSIEELNSSDLNDGDSHMQQPQNSSHSFLEFPSPPVTHVESQLIEISNRVRTIEPGLKQVPSQWRSSSLNDESPPQDTWSSEQQLLANFSLGDRSLSTNENEQSQGATVTVSGVVESVRANPVL